MDKFDKDFFAGYDAVKADIDGMGFFAARDKFNTDNPVGCKYHSLAAYKYAEGGMKALLEAAA